MGKRSKRIITFNITASSDDDELEDDFLWDGGVDIELKNMEMNVNMVAGAAGDMIFAILTGDKSRAQQRLDELKVEDYVRKSKRAKTGSVGDITFFS